MGDFLLGDVLFFVHYNDKLLVKGACIVLRSVYICVCMCYRFRAQTDEHLPAKPRTS